MGVYFLFMHKKIFVLSSAFGNLAMSLQISVIKMLIGNNYEDWYEFLTINLAIMNLDLALRVDAVTQLYGEEIFV